MLFYIPLPTGIANMAETPSTGWKREKLVRRDRRSNTKKSVRKLWMTLGFVLSEKNDKAFFFTKVPHIYKP